MSKEAMQKALEALEYRQSGDPDPQIPEREAIEALRAALAEAQADDDRKDAERYRWLCEDHADAATRQRCRDILEHMGVKSYSANSIDIDNAMRVAGGEG